MDELTNYRPRQSFIELPVNPDAEESQLAESPNLLAPIKLYWKMALAISAVIAIVGLVVVFIIIKPQYEGIATVRVAPSSPSILFGTENSTPTEAYRNFKNDQARLIVEDQRILQRVADDLADKDLEFFKKGGLLGQNFGPVEVLRKAIADETISSSAPRDSEYIRIIVKSPRQDEAVVIADAFSKAYMAIVGSQNTQDDNEKLQLLENERRIYAERLTQQRQKIRELADEYGSVVLTPRQEMMLSRVKSLQDMVTEAESQQLLLETKIELLEKIKDMPTFAEGLLERKQEFVQGDVVYTTLAHRIAGLQEELVEAQQVLKEGNPHLTRSQQTLAAFEKSLEERRQKLERDFDEKINQEMSQNQELELNMAKAELKSQMVQKDILRGKLQQEDLDTINLGRKQLEIEEAQEQMALSKEIYDGIRRRIQEMELEAKRPARMSIPYEALSNVVPNKRVKMSAAVLMMAIAAGLGAAVLRDKVDSSVRSPNDLRKQIGVRILGTTTSIQGVKQWMLPKQVTEDYHTILANLGLIGASGIPKKLVVTSPGIRDGKTTFSVNLATSLAKAGKRVLLIDGDLRKPDVDWILKMPRHLKGLRDLLAGEDFENVIHPVESKGFDVLTAGSKEISNSFKLLSLSRIGEYFQSIEGSFDHMIIDSPPVLGFPDALLWAKLADGVIVISYAGRTSQQDLKDTIERLNQVNVKVLGTVLNSVSSDCSYSRFAYNYYTSQGQARRRKHKDPSILLPEGGTT
ncbi:MAG: polysaccharide biosynthesis tyrosine autokinase [Phycisphaerae bacterium]|jgi:capsular exopolysaccharide synthesis family protein